MSIENSDVELGRAIFRGSFGGSGRSGSGSSDPGNATVMTGLALSDSADGRVLVDTGGQTVAASQGVDLPCTCNVRAGDKVIITLVGNDPTVTGVVGRGDQQQGEIDGAQSSADAANKRAEEARRFAEEVDGKVSDAQADMDAAKRQAEQAKAAADAASRKADQTAADVDRKVKAAADAATQASANASAAAAKADQLSGKVTDVTTTVSGLSTKVEGAARDATSALTASSKTSQSLGALTSTVEQHYTEQQATAGKADRAARDAASSLDRVSKVEQTAAGIKTQVTATAKTASDALSKASTAQQTADAITTKVAKDYATKADADKRYASQSQLTQTAEGLTSKVTTAQQTADAAKTAASTAKQTADGLSVTVESHYAEQRATDAKAADAKAAAGRAQSTADGAVTKATSAQATADGLKASVTKAQTTADSAVKAASSAQQTADAITATVSRDYLSKAGASQSYASKSSVTQTADGIRSEVASTYQTKAGMSAYAEKSYVDQKAGSITQSVEAVMATANGAASSASKANSDLAALSKMATKTYTFATANVQGKYWTRLGSLVSGGDWSNFAIEVMSGDGYNGSSSQNSRMTIVIKDGWQGKPAAYGAFGVSVLRENCQNARVAVMASAYDTCDVWVYLPWQYANGQYTISGAYRSWTQSVLSQADAPTSGVAQDVAYRLNAEQLKADVADTYTTKTEFRQTADAITATVSRDYLSKAGASQSYASKSSVTQTADGIRSEVASTYQTKAGMSAYAEKSYVDQKAGSITQSVEAVMATANGAASSASKANSDLAALSKMATKTYTFATANVQGKYWTRLGSLVSGGDWSNFAIEVMSGDGYNGSSSQNSRMTIVIKDGWQGKPAAYGAFGVSVLRENCQNARVAVMASAYDTCDVWVYLPWQYANGQYTISGAYRSWTQSVLSQADAPTSGVAQDVAYRLNAEQLKADVADTYTTKTEFRQTADAITATVAKKLDSATAASTYAKQSTLTQTADGLSVKVTTAQRTADAAKTAASTAKQTADGAANAANGAKAAADKAQTTAAGAVQRGSSGISSLETALTFDRDGLSIFKKVNGAIQGFIAKVTGSAFQICDKSGTVLSRFADNRIDLGKSSQDTTISMCRDSVRIYSSSKGGAGSKGEVNASYILCDAPVGANNRSSFSIGFGAFSDNPANDMPRETPYVTLGVDDAHGGDSVTIGAQSVRVNWVDWTARHGQATGTGQYPNLARWACSGGLCTVSITHCLDGDLPSWASRTLATGLPRTAAQSWNLSCTQQLPDGTLRDLQVFVEPDNGSPQRSAKVTLAQKGGAGIPSGSWLFVSGTYPLAPDGDWYEPFG